MAAGVDHGHVILADLDARLRRIQLERLPASPRTQGHAFNVHVQKDGSIVATCSGHQPGNTPTGFSGGLSGPRWSPSRGHGTLGGCAAAFLPAEGAEG
ncbi:hypothetical protein WME76_18210 [Sorangium sp. So ce119]|uniref:hypothetical protein n=1 Tax=Sorangium sp. So ce119 TaxID=3133279 RepID=UPI003F5F3D75